MLPPKDLSDSPPPVRRNSDGARDKSLRLSMFPQVLPPVSPSPVRRRNSDGAKDKAKGSLRPDWSETKLLVNASFPLLTVNC